MTGLRRLTMGSWPGATEWGCPWGPKQKSMQEEQQKKRYGRGSSAVEVDAVDGVIMLKNKF
uniref:Uncharacterized protein n=1 Tax=Romanomermis culicivorax TaxID=13658 RepID=A0A915J3P4_ROMCU